MSAHSRIRRETLRRMREMAVWWNLPDGVPERLVLRLETARQAGTPVEAYRIARRTLAAMEIHCLARGRPSTPEYFDARAGKAEGLARMLEGRGLGKAASRQKARAETLRRRAAELRGRGEIRP